jgi:hypothetical protein
MRVLCLRRAGARYSLGGDTLRGSVYNCYTYTPMADDGCGRMRGQCSVCGERIWDREGIISLERAEESSDEKSVRGQRRSGRDPKARSDLEALHRCTCLPACLPISNSWVKEAVCMLELTGRSSLRLFLASGWGKFGWLAMFG